MVTGILYVAICTGWLCKSIHGEESVIPLDRKFRTVEECENDTALAAKWVIGDNFKYRIECKSADDR